MTKEKENWLTKTWVVGLLALFCCALWGSAFPMIKIGYRLFEIPAEDTAAQILFAGCRFTLAGIFAVLAGSAAGRKLLIPRRTSWAMVLKLSIFQTMLQYFLFYIGLANTTGVKASVIEGSNVFISILIASLVFRMEKITWRKLAGCGLGFAGVVIINLGGGGMDLNFRLNGEGFILLSTVAYAISSVLSKRYSQKENPVTLSGYQFICGGIVMILTGLVLGGRLNRAGGQGAAVLIYLAFLSAAAYSVWSILLKYNPVSRVAVFGFSNPVFGVLLSALLLGEADQAKGVKSLIALVLVSAGIFIAQQERGMPKKAAMGKV
ncbi:MAG: DMT family transporter [Lachnospiraceae bacterium]|nr:DMT family transporter [Lachnospiraceae bacterium]